MDDLNTIISSTCRAYRKGPEIKSELLGASADIEVITLDLHPEVPTEEPAGKKHIDVHFLVVEVDVAQAMEKKARIIELLRGLPSDVNLAHGPSYITLGAALGSQEHALLLMALGEVTGIWRVMTPKRLGFQDAAMADRAAGAGYIMTDGFRP